MARTEILKRGVAMEFFRTFIFLAAALWGGWLQGQSSQLTLVATVSMQQLKTEPIKWDSETDERWLKDPEPAFGFLTGGSQVFFGKGGWVYDMGSGKLEKRFPDTLYWPILSEDGRFLFGTLKTEDGSPWGGRFACFDAASGKRMPIKWEKAAYPKYAALHPNNRILTWVDSEDRTGGFYDAVHFVDLSTGQTWKAGSSQWGDNLSDVEGFTKNGRYLVLLGENSSASRLMDLTTFHLLPNDAAKDGFVFNRDSSLVAGTKLEYDGFTFVWDRLRKHYKWKSTESAMPSVFSNNDAYILCEGVIVDASNGKVVWGGLKGERGKFSPDGRSLVTVDKEAFYVYTLPKESEPIFGVFQKPEPWSPAKAPARKPKGKAKTK